MPASHSGVSSGRVRRATYRSSALSCRPNKYRIITDEIVRDVPSPNDAAKEEGGN